MARCIAHAKAHRHSEQTDRTIREMFGAERLKRVPCVGPFDGVHGVPASASKTCAVRFDSDEDRKTIRGRERDCGRAFSGFGMQGP